MWFRISFHGKYTTFQKNRRERERVIFGKTRLHYKKICTDNLLGVVIHPLFRSFFSDFSFRDFFTSFPLLCCAGKFEFLRRNFSSKKNIIQKTQYRHFFFATNSINLLSTTLIFASMTRSVFPFLCVRKPDCLLDEHHGRLFKLGRHHIVGRRSEIRRGPHPFGQKSGTPYLLKNSPFKYKNEQKSEKMQNSQK
jgi:hypothetical protein